MVNRGCQVLIVISIITIMVGGILLTDNNMRELQGREKAHLSFAMLENELLSSVKKIYEQVYTKTGFLYTWCDALFEAFCDVLNSVQERVGKRLMDDG